MFFDATHLTDLSTQILPKLVDAMSLNIDEIKRVLDPTAVITTSVETTGRIFNVSGTADGPLISLTAELVYTSGRDPKTHKPIPAVIMMTIDLYSNISDVEIEGYIDRSEGDGDPQEIFRTTQTHVLSGMLGIDTDAVVTSADTHIVQLEKALKGFIEEHIRAIAGIFT